jgi:protein-tyrosine-phosphatase
MTSDTGAVARIVDGLREIVEQYAAAEEEAKKDPAGRSREVMWSTFKEVAERCLAIAERER